MYNYKTKDLHIQISECLGKVYFPVLVNVTNNHNSFLSLAFDSTQRTYRTPLD